MTAAAAGAAAELGSGPGALGWVVAALVAVWIGVRIWRYVARLVGWIARAAGWLLLLSAVAAAVGPFPAPGVAIAAAVAGVVVLAAGEAVHWLVHGYPHNRVLAWWFPMSDEGDAGTGADAPDAGHRDSTGTSARPGRDDGWRHGDEPVVAGERPAAEIPAAVTAAAPVPDRRSGPSYCRRSRPIASP